MLNGERFALVGVDRDGTIIADRGYLGRSESWRDEIQFLDGAISGLRRLKGLGFKVPVISNQAGVARGYFNIERVEEIHEHLDTLLKQKGVNLDGFYYCPSVDKDYAQKKGIPLDSQWVEETEMRKPGIGMLKTAARRLCIPFNYLMGHIYFIGDKVSDVETGLNANGIGIFLRNGKNEEEFAKLQMSKSAELRKQQVYAVANLKEAADIVSHRENNTF